MHDLPAKLTEWGGAFMREEIEELAAERSC